MKMKRIVSSVLAFSMVASAASAAAPVSVNTADAAAASSVGNYAGALQQSLYFYECQQANELPEWNRVEWKGNCTMDDEIKGGWYDAGDHVKFNLPMAYSASMLAWGLYQYGDGVEKIGQYEIYQNNLEYVLDYLADCDLGDEAVFQVGNGTEDHTWWGPVELYEYALKEGSYYKRPYYTGTGSAVCGEMAAALAAGAAALKGKTDKTAGYIKHAESLFKIADTAKSDADYNDSDASGFYRSSHFYDELFYAANWLYIATGNKDYLDKAKSYIPNLGKELGTSELKYSWSQCWDDVQQGGMLLYAINTGDETYIKQVQKHIDYWTNDVKKLPGGLRWLTTWGCLRYAATGGFMAAVASDTVLKDSPNKDAYKKFYEEQINYILGDNPDGRCYVVGLDESSPKNPHHRTAHGSWKNDMDTPAESRHILYGALVGGPNEDGSYEDDRGNYINNEVATDYNAGFTALFCKMVSEYGGKTDPNFPEPEERTPEYYVVANMKTLDDTGTTISLKFTNHTAWPARVQDNMSFRYYVDLSEVIEKGLNPEDVAVRCDRDQSAMYAGEGIKGAEISGLKQYKGNIYYIEVTMPDGKIAMPISEGRHQCEFLIAMVFPNYGSGWDASNDPSNKGLMDTDEKNGAVAEYIPVYYNGELVYGTEPDGTSAPTAQPTKKPAPTTAPSKDPVVTTAKPAVTEPKATEPKVTEPKVTEPKPTESPKPVTTEPEKASPAPVTTTKTETNPGGKDEPETEPTATNDSTILGDVNCDGKIDVTDLSVLSLSLVDKKELTGNAKKNADVDKDGKIALTDLATIRQYISKKITKF